MPLPAIPLAIAAVGALVVAKRRQQALAGRFLPPGPGAAELWEEANKAFQASEQAAIQATQDQLAAVAAAQGTTAGVLKSAPALQGQGGTTGNTVQATQQALSEKFAGGSPTLSDVQQATMEAAAGGGGAVIGVDAMGGVITATGPAPGPPPAPQGGTVDASGSTDTISAAVGM